MDKIINNNSDDGLFKVFIPLKTDKGGKIQVIEKTVTIDGNDVQRRFILGEASNNKIDKADERVSKSFLNKMMTSLKGLNVFIEHEHHIFKTVGVVSGTEGDSEHVQAEVMLEPEEDNEIVKKINTKIKNGIKLFYSIAGKLTKVSKNFDKELNKIVTELIDGDVYELSITALPEGNVGVIESLVKSMKDLIVNDKQTKKYFSDDDDMKMYKTLTEMVQASGLHDQIYNLFWAFKDAIYRITNSQDLSPTDKKDKIMKLSDEYSVEIERISAELAGLVDTIENDLAA